MKPLEPWVTAAVPMIPKDFDDLNSETFPDHLSEREACGKARRRALRMASTTPLPAIGVCGMISEAKKRTRPMITVVSIVEESIDALEYLSAS